MRVAWAVLVVMKIFELSFSRLASTGEEMQAPQHLSFVSIFI